MNSYDSGSGDSSACPSSETFAIVDLEQVCLEGNILHFFFREGVERRYNLGDAPLLLRGQKVDAEFLLEIDPVGPPLEAPFFRHYVVVDEAYRFTGLEIERHRPKGTTDSTFFFSLDFAGIGIGDIDDINDGEERQSPHENRLALEIFKLIEDGPNGTFPCELELSMSDQHPGAMQVKFKAPVKNEQPRVYLHLVN